MPTLTPQQFVNKWRNIELKESAAAQQHFIDLCRLINHPTPAEADPTGTSFTFEAGVAKSGGGAGFADVWKKGHFAWEYKGKHANLDRAYNQLLQYRESLQNPPLLVVSDTDRIIIHTNFTNTVKRIITLTLDDLLTPDGLQTLKNVFTNPLAFKSTQTAEQVTADAAAEFAKLAKRLRDYGEDPHRTAHFLIRLLFCLFAEDIDLLPNKLFTRLITHTRHNAQAFTAQLQQLFRAMASGGYFGADEILHFNGGLFDDDSLVLELDREGMNILAKLANLDWSGIEPSILGTLFERSLDPAKRTQLGAHYTGKEDILLIVEPVLMQPLRQEWETVKTKAKTLAAKRDTAKSNAARTKAANALANHLLTFADKLAGIQILDPACGSGNFLYVALKQLLDLWKEVSTFAGQLGLSMFNPAVAPSPAQLHGIELNPYAHELAQTTVWIGHIQWLRDNGFGQPGEPILKPIHNIKQMDAILAYDENGNPIEPHWQPADIIIGNPPFLGGGRLRAELGDEYVEPLFKLYGNRLPNFSDLVCYWFEKARACIQAGTTRRAGLLATNSIRGGANRTVLERIKNTGDIFMAHSDRPWVLDGAAVRVSMVGFDNGTEPTRTLDGQPVNHINPDLTGDIDITVAQPLEENAGISFIGPSPKAPFDIDYELAQKMLAAPLNINGRSNTDVVRPVLSGVDIVRRSRNKWTIDFAMMTIDEASEYEQPFEHVKKFVYPIRSKNRRASYAKKWWQYAEARPGMRYALSKVTRFIVTPRVAKYRIFVWAETNTLANDGTAAFAREDDYFFGVLHSKLHELWALRQGTSLEDRPRYTPTTTFETFPFPWAPGAEPAESPLVQAIAAAARELDEKRNAWLNPPGISEKELKKRTLTNLYNRRPTWLQLAHQKLDEAVIAAYHHTDPARHWHPAMTDDQILANLLALNLERAAEQ